MAGRFSAPEYNRLPFVARVEEFIRSLPKAELHLHLEGTLEPEHMLALAERNGVATPFGSVEEARAAYSFDDLASFLAVYEAGSRVLRTAEDFRELTLAYLARARADNVRYAEVFFDPQAHTERGVPFEAVLDGIDAGLEEGRRTMGMSLGLILCFLRDRSPASALATLEQALPHRERLLGVGLDSAERGNPPELFTEVFDRARRHGLRRVAHAGEEGPPEYVRQALDLLRVERIDHGVRAIEDAALVRRLATEQVALTVCPLSNVRLGVFPSLERHSLLALLRAGVRVTLNSDDPAYFGGYVNENWLAVWRALAPTRDELVALAANGFRAAFVPEDERRRLLQELEEHAGRS